MEVKMNSQESMEFKAQLDELNSQQLSTTKKLALLESLILKMETLEREEKKIRKAIAKDVKFISEKYNQLAALSYFSQPYAPESEDYKVQRKFIELQQHIEIINRALKTEIQVQRISIR